MLRQFLYKRCFKKKYLSLKNGWFLSMVHPHPSKPLSFLCWKMRYPSSKLKPSSYVLYSFSSLTFFHWFFFFFLSLQCFQLHLPQTKNIFRFLSCWKSSAWYTQWRPLAIIIPYFSFPSYFFFLPLFYLCWDSQRLSQRHQIFGS